MSSVKHSELFHELDRANRYNRLLKVAAAIVAVCVPVAMVLLP